MTKGRPYVNCPKCNASAPAGTDVCPECGTRLPAKLGYMSDEQQARIRKPLSYICWAILIMVIVVKFFLK